MRVTIVPMGRPDAHSIRMLVEDLAAAGFDTAAAEQEETPEPAYDPARGQYRADALLKMLRRRADERVLGVTDVDLYVSDLNFVFGLADRDGFAAIISLARLAADADRDKARARALKEAVHEIGHTLGLGHCDDPRCVMHFSNCLADTDHKTGRFCATCLIEAKVSAQDP